MENPKKLRVTDDDDEPNDDRSGSESLWHRVRALEKHFEYGGRVTALENSKIFLAGLGCACTLCGGLVWYLVERLMDTSK